MNKRDFLSVESWSDESVDALLALAARLKADRTVGGLEKKILAQVYLDPSLRTRASFETAMALHGGHALTLEPGKGSWAIETDPDAVMNGAAVEHLIEAARVLGRYADAVAVRSFAKESDWATARQDRVLDAFAQHCGKPVINLESARRHPCQELADALTLQERLKATGKKKFVLAWGNHPKPLPTAVPASAALAAARLGMDVIIARPEGYDLDGDDLATIKALAGRRGGSLAITNDLDAALFGADAVYVKSWGALPQFGNPEAEAVVRAKAGNWLLTPERLDKAGAPTAFVMHCLPVRRGVELSAALLDSPRSAITDEAENRLHAQRALLLTLLGENHAS